MGARAVVTRMVSSASDSAVSTAIAAVRSITAYVTIAVYVLLTAPPGMLASAVFRTARHLYWLGQIGVRLGCFLTGIRYRVVGLENIQYDRAAVYCMNHTSNVEPPVVYAALRPLHPHLSVLYKAELRRLVVLAQAFDMAKFVPVERGNRDQSLPAIEHAADLLRRGTSFMIFPEGTRSRTGALLPFKKGGFLMAIKAGAPIVPVGLLGARTAMKRGAPWVRPVTLTIRIGTPVETAGKSSNDRDEVIADVRSRIESLLTEGPAA